MHEVIRANSEQAEVIERSDGSKTISGYAVLWYDGTPKTEYPMPNGRIERIRRADFEPILSQKDPVALRFNHSKDCELDNTGATLVLRADDKGILFNAPYDPTDPDHQKTMAKFNKRQIKGCSFRAIARHTYEQVGNKVIGWLTDIERFVDVSIIGGNVVDKPAYNGTSCIIRSEAEDYEEWRKAKEETEKIIKRAESL